MGVQNVEINALDILKRGFLYMLIAYLVIAIGTIIGAVIGFMALMSPGIPISPTLPSPQALVGTLIVFSVLILLGIGIFIYIILRRIRLGMRLMTQVYGDFGICYKGTTLMLVGPIIMAVGSIVAVASIATMVGGIADFGSMAALRGAMQGAMSGAIILLIGLIITFIGQILVFVIGAFRLHNKYNDTLFIVAGILFIVDIVLLSGGVFGILSLVGCILMYVALGNTIKKLTQMKP